MGFSGRAADVLSSVGTLLVGAWLVVSRLDLHISLGLLEKLRVLDVRSVVLYVFAHALEKLVWRLRGLLVCRSRVVFFVFRAST